MLRFGGTSLGTPSRLLNAAARIEFHVRAGASVVAVVSAPPHRTSWVLHWIKRLGASRSVEVSRELARAARADEDLTAFILAAAVAALDIPVASLRVEEARLKGVGDFGAGNLADLDVRRIQDTLGRGRVVVFPGGLMEEGNGETPVLPAPGADLTAVLLAHELGARACHMVVDRDSLGLSTRSGHTVQPEAARMARERGVTLETYSFRAPFEVSGKRGQQGAE